MIQISHPDTIQWNEKQTVNWLTGLWRNHPTVQKDSNAILQLLSSLLLCYEMTPSAVTDAFIEEILHVIEREQGRSLDLVEESSPLLYATTSLLLRQSNRMTTTWQEGDRRIQEGLKQLTQEEVEEDSRLAYLTQLYGLLEPTQKENMINDRAWAQPHFLLFDTEQLEQQLYTWFLITSMGEQFVVPERARAEMEQLKWALSGCMLAQCQKYQLDVASQLLRAMCYFRYDHELIVEGARFLCFQQRDEGSFGYLNPFKVVSDLEDRALQFHLPITYEILWAIRDVQAYLPKR
ncbi:hypothetical protein [Caldalkalibacillus mannanilyticus]|uniref:hypothetical protein n=1 Tax=Caldalkalibacillus mannanilyticus TaxID=1418 RepID=UPI000468CE98|nr:hypothetical protein [Caldalkalibacillus mannanilyticus]